MHALLQANRPGLVVVEFDTPSGAIERFDAVCETRSEAFAFCHGISDALAGMPFGHVGWFNVTTELTECFGWLLEETEHFPAELLSVAAQLFGPPNPVVH